MVIAVKWYMKKENESLPTGWLMSRQTHGEETLVTNEVSDLIIKSNIGKL